MKVELWITLNEARRIAGCSYRTSKPAIARSISPAENQHFYLCWVTLHLLKRLQQWSLFLCLLIQCLPISPQKWKEKMKSKGKALLQTTLIYYYILHIIYHIVYNYNQLYIARNLRHATVKDAVAVNAKADFRCQNMIGPSFSPTGIIFSTSIFHLDS